MHLKWYQRPPWWATTMVPQIIFIAFICWLLPLYITLTFVVANGVYLLISNYFTNQLLDYKNRPVLITGCDRGFGRQTAIKLADLGVTVFAACYTDEGVKTITDETRQIRGKLYAFKMDVSNDQSVKEGGAFVKKILGGKGLWGVVANAGVLGPTGVDNWLDLEHYKSTFDVNVFGVIRTVHEFLPMIMEREELGGRIVICSSILGRMSLPAVGPYCVSKYSIEGYSEVIRAELFDHNIEVPIINPTFYETTLINRNVMLSSACAMYEKLDETKKLIYGPEFAVETARSGAAIIETSSSTRMHEVADAYHMALFSKYPKVRYMVGWSAQLIWTPLSFMNAAMRIKFYKFFTDIFAMPKPTYANKLTNKNGYAHVNGVIN